jgi:hypothetical protein
MGDVRRAAVGRSWRPKPHVIGTRAYRPEDSMFTLPRIAASAAAALASLALVPAIVAGMQGSTDQAKQTHVRAV